jgi:hypothetical protein
MKKFTIILAALAMAAPALQAAPKDFATTYNAATLTKGTFELENSLLWNNSKDADGFKFAHEFEYGLTDNLQVAGFVKWESERADGATSNSFTSVGVEGTYLLTNPNTSALGSAITLEAALGDVEAALEAKLYLQKNFGSFQASYNVSIESVWAGESYDENIAEFQQSLALGYKVSPSLTVGVEAVQAGAWEGWSTKEENALFVGPSVGYKTAGWWGVVGAQWQVSKDDASADFRGVVSIGFLF